MSVAKLSRLSRPGCRRSIWCQQEGLGKRFFSWLKTSSCGRIRHFSPLIGVSPLLKHLQNRVDQEEPSTKKGMPLSGSSWLVRIVLSTCTAEKVRTAMRRAIFNTKVRIVATNGPTLRPGRPPPGAQVNINGVIMRHPNNVVQPNSRFQECSLRLGRDGD